MLKSFSFDAERCLMKAFIHFHFQNQPIFNQYSTNQHQHLTRIILRSPGRSLVMYPMESSGAIQVTMTNLTRVKGPMAISFNKALETLSDFDSLQQATELRLAGLGWFSGLVQWFGSFSLAILVYLGNPFSELLPKLHFSTGIAEF